MKKAIEHRKTAHRGLFLPRLQMALFHLKCQELIGEMCKMGKSFKRAASGMNKLK